MTTINDKEVLNQIFNPLLPLGQFSFDESTEIENEVKEEDEAENVKIAKELEIEGIKKAELGDYDAALKLFTLAIEKAPLRPSGYNNRAQSYRLVGDIPAAKTDLNNAINLSNGHGRAACQAYCQRGLINLKENRQSEAKSDFEAAARLGSRFAQAQLAQMNPYAALCNKMLNEVFSKLQRGEIHEYSGPEKN